jgi:hypothetical protein
VLISAIVLLSCFDQIAIARGIVEQTNLCGDYDSSDEACAQVGHPEFRSPHSSSRLSPWVVDDVFCRPELF